MCVCLSAIISKTMRSRQKVISMTQQVRRADNIIPLESRMFTGMVITSQQTNKQTDHNIHVIRIYDELATVTKIQNMT